MSTYALIDVDGVLNPYAAKPHRRPEGFQTFYLSATSGEVWDERPSGRVSRGSALRIWFNPDHGPRLLRLAEETGCTLVWATMWEELANEVLAPRLGLPELPVLTFPRSRPFPYHPKTSVITRAMHGDDFVWFDDEASSHDEAYFDEHHNAGSLLVHTNPATGVTEEQFVQAADWLSTRA